MEKKKNSLQYGSPTNAGTDNLHLQEASWENSIDFVAKHYTPEAFDSKKAFRKLRLRTKYRFATAAATITGIILTAVAATFFISRNNEPQHAPQPAPQTIVETIPAEEASHRLEFNDIPLSQVSTEIESTYNVTLSNLPEENPRLTLSYEGTADDLVAAINSILNTDIKVAYNK